jgi:dephospho-CoA kinase
LNISRDRLTLITGMSGSGKTTLAEMFEANGFKVITMGDVIRDIARERGLDPTPENLGKIAEGIRQEEGDAAVAKKCVKRLEGLRERKIIVDGIRSLSEVNIFRKHFDVLLVAVHASPRTRYIRLRGRHRTDDPQDWDDFETRDRRELGFSLGWAVALADHMIVNEGSLEELDRTFHLLLEKLNGP